jgi:L,D-peptidoglycan transpeptidase YkuD (ErfK/YbiS/YcfS/YnhG family)
MSTRAPTTSPQLVVRRLNARANRGVLECGSLAVPCALGRSGTRVLKREGDGATPSGRFAMLEVLYYPALACRPITRLPLRAIEKSDGWCDAAQDRNYNRKVKLPYPASAERLRRDDGLYDVIVVLDYNIRPRVRQRGSAIFMHVARPGFLPTEGCIALRRADLLRVLVRAGRATKVKTAT